MEGSDAASLDVEASSIEALAMMSSSPVKSLGRLPRTPRSPRSRLARSAQLDSPATALAAALAAAGPASAAAALPAAAAGSATPSGTRRRARAPPSKGAHIMTFFEKDINLAAITETTTLYSACRSWMASDATGEILRSGTQENSSGGTLTLPAPTNAHPSKKYKPMRPPELTASGAEAERQAYRDRIDACLKDVPAEIYVSPTQYLPHRDLLEHWRAVRAKDNRAWIDSNKERSKASIEVILSNVAGRRV